MMKICNSLILGLAALGQVIADRRLLNDNPDSATSFVQAGGKDRVEIKHAKILIHGLGQGPSAMEKLQNPDEHTAYFYATYPFGGKYAAGSSVENGAQSGSQMYVDIFYNLAASFLMADMNPLAMLFGAKPAKPQKNQKKLVTKIEEEFNVEKHANFIFEDIKNQLGNFCIMKSVEVIGHSFGGAVAPVLVQKLKELETLSTLKFSITTYNAPWAGFDLSVDLSQLIERAINDAPLLGDQQKQEIVQSPELGFKDGKFFSSLTPMMEENKIYIANNGIAAKLHTCVSFHKIAKQLKKDFEGGLTFETLTAKELAKVFSKLDDDFLQLRTAVGFGPNEKIDFTDQVMPNMMPNMRRFEIESQPNIKRFVWVTSDSKTNTHNLLLSMIQPDHQKSGVTVKSAQTTSEGFVIHLPNDAKSEVKLNYYEYQNGTQELKENLKKPDGSAIAKHELQSVLSLWVQYYYHSDRNSKDLQGLVPAIKKSKEMARKKAFTTKVNKLSYNGGIDAIIAKQQTQNQTKYL